MTLPGLQLQERDRRLLGWLAQCEFATIGQIATSWFPGRTKVSAYDRVRELERAGYVVRHRVWAGLPDVIAISYRAVGVGLIPREAQLVPADILAPAAAQGVARRRAAQPARKRPPVSDLPVARLRHTVDVVSLRQEIERHHPQAQWISERELRRAFQRERREAAGTGGPYDEPWRSVLDRLRWKDAMAEEHVHIPDGIARFPDGKAVIIEYERTPKAGDRARELFERTYATIVPRWQATWWFASQPREVERLGGLIRTFGLDKRCTVTQWRPPTPA